MKVQGTKSDVGVLLLLLAVSLSGNVYLARRAFRPAPAPIPLLAKGATVPPLPVKALDGQAATISYQDVPTVLYVFSPTCPWCRRNIPNLKQLIRSAGQQYRFVGLSVDANGLAAYVAEHQLPLPVYTKGEGDVADRYKLGGVPQTIVISAGGTVLQDWSGAYAGDVKTEVERFFAVKLPGLS
jgi:hypothetical protein